MSKSKKRKDSAKRTSKAAQARRERYPSSAFRGDLQVATRIQQACDLWYRGKRHEARQQLENLRGQHPDHPELLQTLASFAYELGDFPGMLKLSERLVELQPDRPELRFQLASAHLNNMRPASSRRIFLEAVRRWPNHEFVEGARQNIKLTEEIIRESLSEYQNRGLDDLCELSEIHEAILTDLREQRLTRVVERASGLLQRWPDFLPARNNLAEAYCFQGQLDQAIAVARETVAISPDHLYAAACLVRLLTLNGQLDEAWQRCSALAQMPIGSLDHLMAAVQSCSLLGKHQEVLDLIQRGDNYLRNEMCHGRAELHHWAAVAAWNLGHCKPAHKFWQQALEISPSLEAASENLADTRLPVGERHGAWALEAKYWLGVAEWEQILTITRSKPDEEALRAQLQSLLDRRPELVAVLTNMLQHAGPDACEVVLVLAKAIGGGPLVQPLWDFASGQRGSDRFRQNILDWLKRSNLISEKKCRLWLGGQWRDLILVSTQISWEKEREHSPQVETLMAEAFELIVSQPAKAEHLLRQAQQLAPDAPDVLNNLAAVLRKQGRVQAADEIMRDVAARFPDYFFSQIWQAQELTNRGEYDAAHKILVGLYQQPKLHVSEFSSVVAALVQLSLGQDNLAAASRWLQHLEEVNPDFSQLPILQKQVQLAAEAEKLQRGMQAPPRKRKK